MTDKKLKLVFEPGCFDEFDGTQEELNELIAEIEKLFASGVPQVEGRALTDDEEAELFERLQRNRRRPPQ